MTQGTEHMIEPILAKLLEQMPSTAAVIVVVIIFVRFVREREGTYRQLHEEHLVERTLSRGAIDRNTDAMLKEVAAKQELTDRLRSIDAICPIAKRERENGLGMG